MGTDLTGGVNKGPPQLLHPEGPSYGHSPQEPELRARATWARPEWVILQTRTFQGLGSRGTSGLQGLPTASLGSARSEPGPRPPLTPHRVNYSQTS